MMLLILFLQTFNLSHDFAIANFSINQEADTLNLIIKIDKENLESQYSRNEEGTIDLTQENEFVQKYLDQNFYLVVDDKKINFRLQKVAKDKYFYQINLAAQHQIEHAIRHIQLKNTCLIGEVDNHSNIVNFQLNGKYRTFRLHEGRTRIEVKY